MLLPQVDELMEYWKDNPPLHELAAAYLGVKRRATSAPVPFTKISPSIGDMPAPATRPEAANDLGILLNLARRRGGDVSLADLAGIG